MLKLYLHPSSVDARVAAMTAILLDVPVEHMLAGANERVPVLVDGDFVLPEPLAIMTYLATIKGETALYPAQPSARADVLRWMFYAARHVQTRPTIEGLAPLDRHLETREWVSGTSMTLADLALAVPLLHPSQEKPPIEGLAFLGHWLARVQDLDAFKRTSPG